MTNHPIPPLYDKNSRILILGSFPSVKSRESGFFYGHPANRFWQVIAAVFDKVAPTDIEQKKALLLECGIALWDVIASCDVTGSSDSSIKNVKVNDLTTILDNSKVKHIFVNGKTAEKYYNKFIKSTTGIEAITLPSTSPANAAYSLERLVCEWKIIKNPPHLP